MRPRVFPAEDPPAGDKEITDAYRASMRPRVFPAEDSPDDGIVVYAIALQ